MSAPSAGTLRENAVDAGEKARNAIARFHAGGGDFFSDVEPPPLTERHLAHSRILPDRVDILSHIPKSCVCAEVGTQVGWFAQKIWDTVQPREFHIYDIDFTPFKHELFEEPIQRGVIQLHEGDSSTLLSAMPDGHFDFIYVDGDHSYVGVRKDLDQAVKKIKPDGCIVCNDYTVFSPLENIKYGIYRAVNEICLEHGFEILFLGLHRWGYHDVALRRIQGALITK